MVWGTETIVYIHESSAHASAAGRGQATLEGSRDYWRVAEIGLELGAKEQPRIKPGAGMATRKGPSIRFTLSSHLCSDTMWVSV